MGAPASDERPEKPYDSKLMQQNMSHFYAQFSPQSVVICLFVVAITFIPIGGAIIVASDAVFEVDIRYDTFRKCSPRATATTGNFSFAVGGSTYRQGCRSFITFHLDRGLEAPVYMYYRVVGFFQNYRLYAKSMSENQLNSQSVAQSDIGDCEPFRGPYDNGGSAGQPLTVDGRATAYGSMMYVPCGMVAYSTFNDTFSLHSVSGPTTSLDGPLPTSNQLVCAGAGFTAAGDPTVPGQQCEKKGIALSQDVSTRFNNDQRSSTTTWTGYPGTNTTDGFLAQGFYANEAGHRVPIVTDEDFMVWARISPLPDFRKLYRKITADLNSGHYVLEVNEFFDVTSFGGEKHFILATTSWIGGANHVLGALYLTVGVISLVLAFGFIGMYIARN